MVATVPARPRNRNRAGSGSFSIRFPYYNGGHARRGVCGFPGKETTGPGRVKAHHHSVVVTHASHTKGALVMKKFLLLVATAAGVLAIQKKFRDQQAEQDLWAEATDKV